MRPLSLSALATVLVAISGRAQDPPRRDEPSALVLENTGKPLQVPFHCSDEDMQWAGMSCSEEEPCPVYFELTAAEPVGDKIFASGNIHSNTVTLYSVLMGSEDSG